ncbi:hypothetical protein HDV00_006808 [Rhizophlyctis rosea]|nr:hypothetical protein HDV00_006808 [Rhizophlyctis rosea]
MDDGEDVDYNVGEDEALVAELSEVGSDDEDAQMDDENEITDIKKHLVPVRSPRTRPTALNAQSISVQEFESDDEDEDYELDTESSESDSSDTEEEDEDGYVPAGGVATLAGEAMDLQNDTGNILLMQSDDEDEDYELDTESSESDSSDTEEEDEDGYVPAGGVATLAGEAMDLQNDVDRIVGTGAAGITLTNDHTILRNGKMLI